MPRARALRLMSATLLGAIMPAWAPRSVAAANCGQQTCSQATKPKLCCLNHPTNTTASISTCCAPNELCCVGQISQGSAWAMATCCQPLELCVKTPSIVRCDPCPSGMVCGSVCCQTGETCVSGKCCPGGSVCGDQCCPPGSSCASVPSKEGTTRRYICFNPEPSCTADRMCGGVCCPVGSTCAHLPSKPGGAERAI